jgi:hypothetical protein
MTKPTKHHVRQWILGVMSRQSPMSEPDVKAALAGSLEALRIRYPAAAFCLTSMDHVVSKERFWNESAIIKHLDEWWRDNDPSAATAMPHEAASAPVSNTARSWLASWYRARDDTECLKWLRLMHAKCTEAFEYLVRNEHAAATMAVMHFLEPPMTRNQLRIEWDDEDAVLRLARDAADSPLRGILMKILAGTVGVHAPQHGPVMFEMWRGILAGDAPPPFEPDQLPPPEDGSLF